MALTTEELDISVRLVLCDSAVVAGGKLFVQGGGWSLLTPPAIPARVGRLGLAAVVEVPYTQTNRNHHMTITLEDGDGQLIPLGTAPPDPSNPASVGPRPITEMNADLNVGRPPILQGGEAQTIPIAINLEQLLLPTAGMFSFVMRIGDREVERASFRVVPPAFRPRR